MVGGSRGGRVAAATTAVDNTRANLVPLYYYYYCQFLHNAKLVYTCLGNIDCLLVIMMTKD